MGGRVERSLSMSGARGAGGFRQWRRRVTRVGEKRIDGLAIDLSPIREIKPKPFCSFFVYSCNFLLLYLSHRRNQSLWAHLLWTIHVNSTRFLEAHRIWFLFPDVHVLPSTSKVLRMIVHDFPFQFTIQSRLFIENPFPHFILPEKRNIFHLELPWRCESTRSRWKA